jgi:uncharacterized tellurite resistance protein B-like protein
MIFQKLNELFSTPKSPRQPDAKLAVAELLIHASLADGHLDAAETETRDRLLKQKFELSENELSSLTAQAETAYREAIDYFRFTNAIKEAYDREQRETILEMMCEIMVADGNIDNDELNLGWRVAGLLGFTTREWVTVRKKVEETSAKR